MYTIIYFHGYGSSSKTDKVQILKDLYPDKRVLAFDADIDPDIAKHEVGERILFALLDDIHSEDELYFVGTSLGAWLASTLSDAFDCPAILINPSSAPYSTLERYCVPEEIRSKYQYISLNRLNKKQFFIDLNDEVVDHSELIKLVDYIPITGGHRCTGEHFINVMNSAIK
jgi:predicted esterase YcpF (UPF0227 family)